MKSFDTAIKQKVFWSFHVYLWCIENSFELSTWFNTHFKVTAFISDSREIYLIFLFWLSKTVMPFQRVWTWTWVTFSEFFIDCKAALYITNPFSISSVLFSYWISIMQWVSKWFKHFLHSPWHGLFLKFAGLSGMWLDLIVWLPGFDPACSCLACVFCLGCLAWLAKTILFLDSKFSFGYKPFKSKYAIVYLNGLLT